MGNEGKMQELKCNKTIRMAKQMYPKPLVIEIFDVCCERFRGEYRKDWVDSCMVGGNGIVLFVIQKEPSDL